MEFENEGHPEDDKLDRLLRFAAAQPGGRPEFIECLLDSQIWVIGEHEPGSGHLKLHELRGDDGEALIPFFSSTEAAERLDPAIPGLLGLPARTLFELTRGARLMLNPGSEIAKEFLPGEIAALLEHGSGQPLTTRVLARDTPVQIAEPLSPPVAMVDALTTLFSRHPEVGAAWLALMQEEGSGRPPCLLLALDARAPFDQALAEAALVASETAPADMAVDLIVVDDSNEGLSGLLRRHLRPFYEARWGMRLREAAFPAAGRA